ncbi:hypothetical protein BHU11_00655 [Tannerella sp. oral taxon 808]|nr:hypothetical protein BHU11_00655 [Tannerella sp. oral taxon 808]
MMRAGHYTVAGVRRDPRFSPQHEANDEAIFRLTAEALRARGYTVQEYTEADLWADRVSADAVFGMARDPRSIRRLQRMEDGGLPVINSGYGIANCGREPMTRLLTEAALPHPRSLILPTADDPTPALDTATIDACWVKRADGHVVGAGDVTFAADREAAREAFRVLYSRGVRRAVVNEHLTGDLVKFYGVAGTDFFYAFYPTATRHGKFGLEQVNGAARGIVYDADALRTTCNRAATVLGLRIYGGDCIVSDTDGLVRLIDFNDWPSFAPCREVAAPFIASCIHRLIAI